MTQGHSVQTLAGVLLIAAVCMVHAYSNFPGLIPNGNNVPGCAAIGHTNCNGAGTRTSFGNAFLAAGTTWSVSMCEGDADNDGKSNGDELGDGCCLGVGSEQFTTDITHPGLGGSTTSRDSCVLAAPATPGALTFSSVTDTSMTVSWTYGATQCACGWVLQMDDGNGGAFTTVTGVTRTDRSKTISSLSSGKTYQFKLKATNRHASDSAEVTASQATTVPTSPPSAPGNARVTATGLTFLTMAWDAAGDNGTPVQLYNYELALNGQLSSPQVSMNTTAGVRVANVTGLTNNTAYQFRVRAYNTWGFGAFSTVLSVNTNNPNAAVPDTPATPTVSSRTSRSALLTWSAPASNGASITSYTVQSAVAGGAFSVAYTGSQLSNNITGLARNTQYRFRVRATNSIGDSAFSGEATTTTLAETASAPQNTAVSAITQTGATYTWSSPSDNGGSPVTRYEVERRMGTGAWTQVLSTSDNTTTSFSANNLTASTSYTMRVRAVTSGAGNGMWSSESQFETESALTPTVGANEYSTSAKLANGAITLSWKFLQSDTVIEFAVVAETTGYACIGFDPDPTNGMKNVDMYLGRVDNGVTSVLDLWSTDKVTPQEDTAQGGTSDVLAKAGSRSGNKLTFKFQRKLNTGDSKDKVIKKGPMTLVWAIGATPSSTPTSFSKHTTRGIEEVNLATGAGTGPTVSGVIVAHGLLMFVGWLVCVAGGAILARFFKRIGHAWYVRHRAVQSLGVLLAVVGFFVAVLGVVGTGSSAVHFDELHGVLGLLIVLMGVAQPMIGIYANRTFDPERTETPVWPDMVHAGVGWLALLLAVFNSYTGLVLAGVPASDPVIAIFWVFIALLVCLWLFLTWYNKSHGYAMNDNKSGEEHEMKTPGTT